MAFMNKLRELLSEREMKPTELAKRAEISEAIVSQYLSGKKQPSGGTCIRLAEVLNVSLDELLETKFMETHATRTIAVTDEAYQVAVLFDRAGEDDKAIIQHALNKYTKSSKPGKPILSEKEAI